VCADLIHIQEHMLSILSIIFFGMCADLIHIQEHMLSILSIIFFGMCADLIHIQEHTLSILSISSRYIRNTCCLYYLYHLYI